MVQEGLDSFFEWLKKSRDSGLRELDGVFKVIALVAPGSSFKGQIKDQFRDQGDYARLLAETYGSNRITFASKEVLNKDDFNLALDQVRIANIENRRAEQQPAVDMIHFIGHSDGAGLYFPEGSPLRISQREDREAFEGLGVECLLFSCCQIGRKKDLLRKLGDESDALMVLAYRTEVEHYEAYLIDSMIYHLLYGQSIEEVMSYHDIGNRLTKIIEEGRIWHKGLGGGRRSLSWWAAN